jgi:carbonic anhydrase
MVTLGLIAALSPLFTTDSNAVALAALDALKTGNQRFVSGQLLHGNQNPDRRAEVAKGQKPFAMVLTCADSRLSPEIIFDQGLGDLFVVRVAGNVADANGMASLEYATEHLGCQLLIVLGHERCGAVKAALDTFQPAPKHEKAVHGHAAEAHEGFIPGLLHHIYPAVAKAQGMSGDKLDNSILCNVVQSVSAVTKAKPFANWVASGRLTVVGAFYDLDSGSVKMLTQSQTKPGSSHVEVHKN